MNESLWTPLRLASVAHEALWVGGADRDRTDDPLLAKQVLSQLSYSPFGNQKSETRNQKRTLVFWFLLSSFWFRWWA